MQVDWITVSAQIVNFLILVWLLKRFLYQPVIRAMDSREQRINQRLDDARASQEEADRQAAHYREEREELERQRTGLLDQARDEAAREKKQMLQAARAEVRETRAQWHRQTAQERAELLENLRGRAAEAVWTTARKTLSDLANATLEAQIVEVFVARLEALDAGERKALARGSDRIRIASAFELDSGLRARLTRAVHDCIAEGVEVTYAVSEELLCGIRLDSEEQQLSWNLADYLDGLATRIEAAFSPRESQQAGD
ncbi:MAG: hypothetical protein LJE60_13495 [Thiocapsa sp.]|nr:hypothetical protein [Thiocapsa sp.]MCG6898104.1 hypothetical protein [Thiocapsa sp.]